MDRLLAMESLVVAVDAGTLTLAAERIGTAKSVVSKRISELERRLGVRLLNRTARRLSLTEAGAAFCDQARRLLSEVKEAEDAAAGLGAQPRGVIRIAAPMSFGTLHLRKLAIDVMQRCPELVVDLDLDDRYVDLANEGYDLAVRIGRLSDSSLIARKIAPNRHLICASPDYLRRRGTPATPDDLQHHDGLLYTTREAHGMWQIQTGSKARSYRIMSRMRCNNGEVLQAAAIGGLGLAILPSFLAASHVERGDLTVVLQDHALPASTISAVYMRERQLSAKVRTFVDALLAAYSPIPPWDQVVHREGD